MTVKKILIKRDKSFVVLSSWVPCIQFIGKGRLAQLAHQNVRKSSWHSSVSVCPVFGKLSAEPEIIAVNNSAVQRTPLSRSLTPRNGAGLVPVAAALVTTILYGCEGVNTE